MGKQKQRAPDDPAAAVKRTERRLRKLERRLDASLARAARRRRQLDEAVGEVRALLAEAVALVGRSDDAAVGDARAALERSDMALAALVGELAAPAVAAVVTEAGAEAPAPEPEPEPEAEAEPEPEPAPESWPEVEEPPAESAAAPETDPGSGPESDAESAPETEREAGVGLERVPDEPAAPGDAPAGVSPDAPTDARSGGEPGARPAWPTGD